MALSNIEKHYNKHPEDLRLQRRHGIVEFETTMHHLRRFINPDSFLLDIGAGTGRYASALMAEGYRVKAVEVCPTSKLSYSGHSAGDEYPDMAFMASTLPRNPAARPVSTLCG